jgi:D-glycero-alpha-D-manno-heptose-7-phosphate kinase
LIIARTPLRVSFFGGGTDYPSWIKEHGGAVIGTSINHFSYISCRYLPPFFEHKYRVCYSKMETKKSVDEIEHPAVNAILRYLDYHGEGLEILYNADLPARTGLGSSSAFVVGTLNALMALRGKFLPKHQLSRLAIRIEQEILNEVVGSQDQVLTACGGFNQVIFSPDGSISVHPVIAPLQRIEMLQDYLMLFFTGFSRLAPEVAKAKVANFHARQRELHRMQQMVDVSLRILQDGSEDLCAFGELLHETWELKRSLSEKVSSPEIDAMYQKAREAGAIGGKLLGAGGGGFLLLFVRPEDQEKVKEVLHNHLYIPFRFENAGSSIVVYQPSGFGHHV